MSESIEILNCNHCNWSEYLPKDKAVCIWCGSKDTVLKEEVCNE